MSNELDEDYVRDNLKSDAKRIKRFRKKYETFSYRSKQKSWNDDPELAWRRKKEKSRRKANKHNKRR